MFRPRNAAGRSRAVFKAHGIPDQSCLASSLFTLLEGSDPLSCPQMNGEVLWQVRDFRTLHEIFRNLHVSLVKLGYKLASSCGHRVGLTVYRRVKHLMDKSRAMTNNESRKAMRSSYWCKVSLRPDEMRRHSAPRKER